MCKELLDARVYTRIQRQTSWVQLVQVINKKVRVFSVLGFFCNNQGKINHLFYAVTSRT